MVYHDVDALTLGDIGELYDTDLEGYPLAGRTSKVAWAESGFGHVYRAATRVDADVAAELRRRMHVRFPFDFLAFDAGSSCSISRACARTTSHAVAAVGRSLRDEGPEVLNAYVGPHRKALPGHGTGASRRS